MKRILVCPKCFNSETEIAIFCSQCSTRLIRDNPPPTRSSASDLSKIGIIGGIVLFAFLAVGALVSLLIQPTPKLLNAQNPALSTPYAPAEYISNVVLASSITGKVVAITDGDTVIVLDDKKVEHKIRLDGIDAPEKAQDFGDRAKQNLSDLVFGKIVSVVGNKTDKYGRTVAKIVINGIDASLEQIKAGYAWHYKKYENEQSEADRKAYAEAEVAARKLKLNIWSMPNPTAPWDYRAGSAIDPALKDKIIGNKNSFIYHWAGCAGFAKVAEKNRVLFNSWEEAEDAGYRAARNCSTPKPKKPVSDNEDLPDLDLYTSEADSQSAPTSYYSAPVMPKIPEPTPQVVVRSTPSYSAPVYDPPAYSRPPPSTTATALCMDGTYSYSQNRQGTCSYHGGVSSWLNSPDKETSSASTTDSSPSYANDSDRPKTVQVRGYYRKDGTFVRPHTRSAPKRRN